MTKEAIEGRGWQDFKPVDDPFDALDVPGGSLGAHF
jgi:hypothetical protein